MILTKLDGDARGGAALSIYGVTKKPIKYIGIGEKTDALEEFHPDRMAGRILQQGDIISLVEKAQETFDVEATKKLEKKVRKEGMDLNDFLAAMKQIQKLGPLEGVLKMLPGVNTKMLKQANADPRSAQVGRGDRALDDDRGAQEARAAQRIASLAGREGKRAADQRGEPPARAVPRYAEDDEEDGWRRAECRRECSADCLTDGRRGQRRQPWTVRRRHTANQPSAVPAAVPQSAVLLSIASPGAIGNSEPR